MLSNEKKERIAKYKFINDKIRTLYSDLLIRYILVEYNGFLNDNIKFLENEYGKPYIEGRNIHFNCSHSENILVCTVDKKPIGIDVEKIFELDIYIAKDIFTEAELNILESKQDKEKKECFFDIWTLKESYIKAIRKDIQKVYNLR